jgi:transcriptional regulator with XRE-family HTH domain
MRIAAGVMGMHLADLREKAGLKQNELAKKLEWSAAVLSRVEGGERNLSDDELSMLLSRIGTPEALKVRELLTRQWSVLPEPHLNDPDVDLLWEAEQAAQQIHELSESPEVKQFFERRLMKYEEELAQAAQRVMDRRFRIVFVGTIAVGKSTAICRVEGLEIPTQKGMPKAVLETGAGGITICEVHIRKGPGYGLVIEPCSEEEIRQYVSDFANFLMNAPQTSGASDQDESEVGSPGISREVERAVRNMTGLRRKRSEKKSNGEIVPAVDAAKELAKTMPDSKALCVELLSRMELHKRDRRDIWHSEVRSKGPLEWMQELFESVNNGRHPEFTIPKRIELMVPGIVLKEDDLTLTLVDTQGIDDVAGRADLEQHFDDPHTLVVLCSVFNEAPSTTVRQLLVRAKEGGVRTMETNVAILALPRPGEAIAMKDNGFPAQTDGEGYELKNEEVVLKLQPMGLSALPVLFFNAAEDVPESLRLFLIGRIRLIQEHQRSLLREIIAGANALLQNYEKEQSREMMMAASRRLSVWLASNSTLPKATPGHVEDSLLSAVQAAHHRTIYATVVRDGTWYNLDYSHQLSHGARRIATQIVEPKLSGFRSIADNLLEDEQFEDAHDLVRQTVRVVADGFDNIVRKAQLVGQSIFADELSKDSAFWVDCAQQWGLGSGYRNRINERNRVWFEGKGHAACDDRVMEIISETWSEVVHSIRDLMGDSGTPFVLGK